MQNESAPPLVSCCSTEGQDKPGQDSPWCFTTSGMAAGLELLTGCHLFATTALEQAWLELTSVKKHLYLLLRHQGDRYNIWTLDYIRRWVEGYK